MGTLAGGAVTLNTSGAVTETAGSSLSATSLGGAAASLNLPGVNQIANISGFTATGGVLLNDGTTALTLTGPLNAGGATVNITAASFIETGGTLTAGLLTGSTAGATTLATTVGNNINDLGPYASGGSFSLTDSAPLRLVGALNAGANTVTLNATSLSQTSAGIITAGTLAGTMAGVTDLSTATNAIVNLGPFTNTGGSFALNDGAQVLTLTGAVNADGNTVAITAGTLSQTATSKLTAGALAGTVAGATNLGTAANAVANIATYSSGGNFTLADGATPLNILGTLNAGANTVTLSAASVSQSASGSITAGALVGTTAGKFDLGTTPNTIATLASITSGGSFTLNDGTTPLTITGPVNVGANVFTITAGTLAQTSAGVVTAGTLTGSTLGTTDLSTATNAIVALGAYTVSGGNFRLNDGTQALSLAGALNVGASSAATPSGIVAITAGSLTETGGLITAGTLTGAIAGDAILTLGNNSIAILDAFTSGGRFALVNGPDLTVTGAVRAGGAAPNIQMTIGGNLTLDGGSLTGSAVALQVGGALTERNNGLINAGTLTASAAQIDALTAGNNVGAFGAVSAARGVRFADAASLTVNGPLQSSGGDVSLTSAGAIAVPGTVTAAGAASFQGQGVGFSGTVNAGSVSADAGRGGLTQSGTILGGSAIAFKAGTTAVLSGIERAQLISVIAPGIELRAGDIVVGGVPQPSGVKVEQLPKFATSTSGLFLEAGSSFLQSGTTFVSPGFGASQATIRVDLTSGTGTAQFGTLFSAQQGNLIVDIGGGSIPSGNINVRSLFVIYSGTGVGAGTVNLNGTIGGQTGTAAASAAQISPAATQNFRINSCALASVNCVVLRAQALPVGNPLKELSLSFFREQDDDSELVVPNVSDQGL